MYYSIDYQHIFDSIMKIKHITIAAIFVFGSLLITSCNDQKKHSGTNAETPEVADVTTAEQALASTPEKESSGEIVNMSPEEFQALVSSQPFVVVDFYATWCRPCIQMAPHLEKIADGYEDNQFKLVKIDAERNVALSQQEKISGYPTLKIYKDGKEVKTSMGGMDEAQLRELFGKYM